MQTNMASYLRQLYIYTHVRYVRINVSVDISVASYLRQLYMYIGRYKCDGDWLMDNNRPYNDN